VAAPRRLSHRRREAALIALFAVAAITLSALALSLRQAPAWGPDLAIALWVQGWRSPDLTGFFVLVSWLGYFPQNAVATIALAAAFRRDRFWVVGTFLATLLAVGLKLLVGRPRPTDERLRVYAALQDQSFPSGHVVFYTSLFGFAIFLVHTHLPRSPARALLVAALALPIALVGLSRVYLGHHWPSDVLGGYALAAAMLVPYCALYARRRVGA
jgi:membrane-associated phospholipid phosphatase